MPNFENIAKLRDHLVKLRESGREDKFDMTDWLYDLEQGQSIDDLGDAANPECGTAACLAGHVVVLNKAFGAHVSDYATVWLGLSSYPSERDPREFGSSEEGHVFYGHWRRNYFGSGLESITLADAIEYLNLALERRDVMVSLPPRAP